MSEDTNNVDNLVLQHLRDMREDIQDIKLRLTTLEDTRSQGTMRLAEFETHIGHLQHLSASQNRRLDRIEMRLDLVDSRLDKVDSRLEKVDSRLQSLDCGITEMKGALGHIADLLGAEGRA